MISLSFGDFLKAYRKAKKGKLNHNFEIYKFCEYENDNLRRLYYCLISGNYTIGKPIRNIIANRGILREIIYLPFRDRIVQHVIYNFIYPLIEHKVFHDVYGGMIGKGNLYAVKRISRFMRSCTDNFTKNGRILKLDIQSFYLSIDREVLWEDILNLIKINIKKQNSSPKEINNWKGILAIIKQFIFKDYRYYKDISSLELRNCFPSHKAFHSTDGVKGMPHGNLVSQLFANLYLHKLDVFIKKILKIRYYGRYIDDFILIHQDKNYLLECREKIRIFLREELKLSLHPKKIYLQPISKGVNFLGVMIYPYYRTLSKKIIYYGNKNIQNIEDIDKSYQVLMSYDGLAKYHQNYRLREKWKHNFDIGVKKSIISC